MLESKPLSLRNSALLMGHYATPVVTLFFSLTHVNCMALHHTVVIRYSTSLTHRALCHASSHLVIYRKCYRFESIFYSQAFSTLQSFLLFQGFPGASSSTSKLAGLPTDLLNIAPTRLFVWITAIHRRFVCGRFYLRSMADQSQNINLHGELVLK